MFAYFAALAIPENLWSDLDALYDDALPGADWRDGEHYHVTLCYFGALTTQQAADLDSVLTGIRAAPLSLALKGAHWFGRKSPRALYVGVAEETAVRHLAHQCERAARALGIGLDKQPYTPHVTVAYLEDTSAEDARLWSFSHARFASEPALIKSFTLFSSRPGKYGNTYHAEREYLLL